MSSSGLLPATSEQLPLNSKSSPMMTARMIPKERVDDLLQLAFQELEDNWSRAALESPYKRWYGSIAQGVRAYRAPLAVGRIQNSRSIAWKITKSFDLKNLCFRTVDTGRLLPLTKINQSVLVLGHPATWNELESHSTQDFTSDQWIEMTLSGMAHELFLMLGFHEKSLPIVPVILLGWDDDSIDFLMDYWVEVSKGELSEEKCQLKFQEIQSILGTSNQQPPFHLADQAIRALLDYPLFDHSPPFIIFSPARPKSHSTVLFTHPLYAPDSSLLSTFPRSCGGESCNDPECSGFFDFTRSRVLAGGNGIPRRLFKPTVMCNFPGCEIEYEAGNSKMGLLLCVRCKEVQYCTKEHQVADWNSAHKFICEDSSKNPEKESEKTQDTSPSAAQSDALETTVASSKSTDISESILQESEIAVLSDTLPEVNEVNDENDDEAEAEENALPDVSKIHLESKTLPKSKKNRKKKKKTKIEPSSAESSTIASTPTSSSALLEFSA